MKFDPFEKRPDRDLRNDLGSALCKSLESGTTDRFEQTRAGYLKKDLSRERRAYIEKRTTALEKILNRMEDRMPGPEKTDRISRLLWKAGLYFEFHEWMETQWRLAAGRRKKALQALILIAVACEHLQYRRVEPAEKLARKALERLGRYSDDLPAWVDLEDLTDTFNHPDRPV